MKRAIKVLSLVMILVVAIACFASCGKKLSGKYELSVLGTGASYDFSGSKVTVTAKVAGQSVSFEGEYEIKTNDDDKEVIVFTFSEDDKDAKAYSGEFSFSEGKDGDTEYIKIAGIQYNKVK